MNEETPEEAEIKLVDWNIRNRVFIYHSLNGLSLQDAYDLAMCRMYRLVNKSLGWGKPPIPLIEKLNNYAEKTEEE